MAEHDAKAQCEWETTCSTAFTSDVLWKLDAYRAALFLIHSARTDARDLRARGMSRRLTDQLLEAAGSVSGNLSEGYSRPTRADRLRVDMDLRRARPRKDHAVDCCLMSALAFSRTCATVKPYFSKMIFPGAEAP